MNACIYACSAAQKDLSPSTQSRPHNETCEFLRVNEEPHYTPVRREDGFTVPLAPLTELKTRIKNVTFSKLPLPLCSFLLQAPSLAVSHQEWKNTQCISIIPSTRIRGHFLQLPSHTTCLCVATVLRAFVWRPAFSF